MTDSAREKTRGNHDVPDGWLREDVIGGMDTVGFRDGADIGGGFKCDPCGHFIPIDALDDDVCPMCGRGGMIGTIVAGVQEFTLLYPANFYDKEVLRSR